MQPVFELMTEYSDVAGTFNCLGSTAEQRAVPTEFHFTSVTEVGALQDSSSIDEVKLRSIDAFKLGLVGVFKSSRCTKCQAFYVTP